MRIRSAVLAAFMLSGCAPHAVYGVTPGPAPGEFYALVTARPMGGGPSVATIIRCTEERVGDLRARRQQCRPMLTGDEAVRVAQNESPTVFMRKD